MLHAGLLRLDNANILLNIAVYNKEFKGFSEPIALMAFT